MSTNDTARATRFTVHGDGRHHGDDGSSGRLAGMTLYVVRALAQVDQILGVGELSAFRARGGPQELHAQVGHQGDFGLEVVAHLSRTDLPAHRPAAQALAGTDELETVLDHVTTVPLVAGCFVVAANGTLLADRVPGIDRDALAGTGRRMKVAHDAFDRLLGTTALVTQFTWAQVVAASVGNGLAVAVADLTCDADAVVAAVRVGGGVPSGVDLGALRTAVPVD